MQNDVIKFYGTTWCSDCMRSRAVLNDMKVEYDYINIDEDSKAAEYVQKINNGYRSVPTIVFPDGKVLVEPRNDDLILELNKFNYK